MRMLEKGIGRLNNAVMSLVAIAILLSMLAGAFDVIGGQFFNRPLPGAVEGATNLLPVIIFGSLAYVQQRREHIRVELLYARLGARGRAALDVLNVVLLVSFLVLLLRGAWREALRSFLLQESAPGIIDFPMWPAKFVIVLGAALMIVQLLLDLVTHSRQLVTGQQADEADELGGVSGLLGEVKAGTDLTVPEHDDAPPDDDGEDSH